MIQVCLANNNLPEFRLECLLFFPSLSLHAFLDGVIYSVISSATKHSFGIHNFVQFFSRPKKVFQRNWTFRGCYYMDFFFLGATNPRRKLIRVRNCCREEVDLLLIIKFAGLKPSTSVGGYSPHVFP